MLYGELPKDGGFTIKIANPPKQAILRLPTSKEIVQYNDSQKTIRRPTGKGREFTTEVVKNEAVDLTFFAALRVDKDGPEFDAAEARKSIQRIISVSVLDYERDGDRYVIVLTTPFGNVKHSVGIPSEKQLSQFRPVVSKDLAHGKEELRYHTESGMDLYDAVGGKGEGYADGTDIPAHHKFAVANELANAIEQLGDDFEPNP